MAVKKKRFIEVDERKVRRVLQIIALGNMPDLHCPKCGRESRWGVNNIALVTNILLEKGSAEFTCPDPGCKEVLVTYIFEIKNGLIKLSIITPKGVIV